MGRATTVLLRISTEKNGHRRRDFPSTMSVFGSIGIAASHVYVGVDQLPMFVPINAHAVSEQGIQPHHTPHSISDNL